MPGRPLPPIIVTGRRDLSVRQEERAVTPSDSTSDAARPDRPIAVEVVAAEIVAEALAEASPRAAALALLRFDAYLGLVRIAGLEIRPNGALAGALRAGLIRICRADAACPVA